MPLTTTSDRGHHNKKRDIVRFFMQNEKKERIRCGVTNHALEVFELDFNRKTNDPLTTFNAAYGAPALDLLSSRKDGTKIV